MENMEKKSIKNNTVFKIDSGMSIINAGAYKGESSIIFGNLVFPYGKVYAFEPSEQNFNILKNIYHSCIIPINFALSNYTGKGILSTHEVPKGYLMVDPTGFEKYIGTNNLSEINVTYIDKFCKDNKIDTVDLIKIDVEGQELNVLKGAKRTIKNKDIVLIIEIHNQTEGLSPLFYNSHTKTIELNSRKRFPNHKREIYNFLISRGFRIYDTNYVDITEESIEEKSHIVEIIAKR